MGPWPRLSFLSMLPLQIFNWHQGKYSKVSVNMLFMGRERVWSLLPHFAPEM